MFSQLSLPKNKEPYVNAYFVTHTISFGFTLM
jgi:hypothetical protein